ncbi:MAG TPA: hypothetical protein VJV05_03620 [Pyrinomonadaceae bacterium]|nr:hypothetical protein [Pyrinomonadaceae bacterium]
MAHFKTRVSTALIFLCVPFLTSIAAAQPLRTVYFEEFLSQRFGSGTAAWNAQEFCPTETNLAARRVFESYGALYVAADTVSLPSVCIYDGEGSVLRYQKQLKTEVVEVRIPIALQTAAARSLRVSVDEITASGLRLSPLDGAIAGGRTYGDTLMLWNSRVFPALTYWNKKKRITSDELYVFAGVELANKILTILEWEEKGIYFSTDRSRSILTSTAPPGSSQHISLLAFDIVEYWNPSVRSILNKNGWYQTVVDDPPHFTYLGLPEGELPGRGLKMVSKAGHNFWVPNLAPRPGVLTN